MFEKAVIFGLYSITPVHAGSGAELSVIDLPIQRERHTGFPMIWGQSLKGVLRRAYEELSKSKEKTEIIFGPPTDRAHEHAGAISVGDAKILLFPVRSAKGVFAYVTCPEVLERFARDLEFIAEITGKKELKQNAQNLKIGELKDSNAVAGEALIFNEEHKEIILEDVVLKIDSDNKILENTINALKKVFGEKTNDDVLLFGRNVESIQNRLAIVNNDVFGYFVKFTTEIVARVRIDAEKGTVAQGGLWYEEFLPADTLMYSLIAIGKPRKDGLEELNDAGNIAKILTDVFSGIYLQVGGNETVGKGFMRVQVWGENNESKSP